MTDKLNISSLQHPEDILAEQGEYALFGLYVRVYWQYMELLQANTEPLSENLDGGVMPNYSKAYAVVTKTEEMYEQWIALAAEILPEWAIGIMAEIDNALDKADGQGME